MVLVMNQDRNVYDFLPYMSENSPFSCTVIELLVLGFIIVYLFYDTFFSVSACEAARVRGTDPNCYESLRGA